MKCLVLALALVIPGSALAQQPTPMIPSQLAIAIDRAVGELASAAEKAQADNQALQKQVESLTKQLAEKDHPPVLRNHGMSGGGAPSPQQDPIPQPPLPQPRPEGTK